MTNPRTTTAPSPLPTSIWLPGPRDADTPPPFPAVLPDWAIGKIRTEFTQRHSRQPAPLWRLTVCDTNEGMDARTPCAADHTPGARNARRTPVILAELHPDTLPATTPHSRYGTDEQGAIDNGWPGFLHRTHRLLRTDDVLLLATRQRRDAGKLTDPLGLLIAAARTAGFRYLQHIVIVHGHAVDDQIVATPPEGTPPGLIHSDLLVLSAVHTA
ncbi:hypothetical protein [Streptomyces sp. WM6378]|uniref:hypothetical protein n=1 Tax=Streptomyces sp. WM6378 TaxID=1415557 RepID=UPI0006AE3482|nr:hypothetical protein [Streptomyces sp. WM6378]KOU38742.1 hypothetical protein ADK54_27755 [Streptomyces sp. WM6378]